MAQLRASVFHLPPHQRGRLAVWRHLTTFDQRVAPPAPGWSQRLAALLAEHNHGNARSGKPVSARTMQLRAQGLRRCFAQLHAMGCRIDPLELDDRHVRRLVHHWSAQAFAPAYIEQQLSLLRVFAGWIGKPGMIGKASDYLGRGGDEDSTWPDLIAAVERRDPLVALQLELMLVFNLTRAQAVLFVPERAGVQPDALAEPQRSVLARALATAAQCGGGIAAAGLSRKQALDRFTNTLRAAGITRRGAGITPHGLRRQFFGADPLRMPLA